MLKVFKAGSRKSRGGFLRQEVEEEHRSFRLKLLLLSHSQLTVLMRLDAGGPDLQSQSIDVTVLLTGALR